MNNPDDIPSSQGDEWGRDPSVQVMRRVFAAMEAPNMLNGAARSYPFWKDSGLPLTFFVLVSILMVGPHVVPPTRINALPYAHEDSNIFLWGFWWVKRCLLEWHDPYWADFLFYPLGTSLAFHPLPLTYGLFSFPIQVLLGDLTGLVVAFNCVIFVSFVLSGFGAYRLAVYVTGNQLGGWIGGLIFAFMPFHFLNMNSLHLLAIEVLPFYVLSLLKLWDRPSVHQGIFLAAALAVAYYTSLEYALYLLIFSALWLIYKLVFSYKDFQRKFLTHLALASLCFIVFAAPLLSKQAPMLFLEHSAIRLDFDEVVFWSPAILSFVTPSRAHPVYGDAMSFAGDLRNATTQNWGMRSEISLGFVTLGLAFVALAGLRRDGRMFWGLAALWFICLTLGPYLRVTGTWLTGIPLPYLFFYKYLPFFQEGRDPTRFMPLAVLMLSVLAAFGVRDLLERTHRKERLTLFTVILSGLILFENMSGWVGSYRPEVNPVYNKLGQMPADFAIIDLTMEPHKLLPQTVHGKKITYIEKTIPRSSSRNWMLPVEYDFRSPEKLLNLDPAVLATRFNEHKMGMKKFNIQYIIFPMSEKAKVQIELAMHLGGRVSRVQGLFLCEFPQGKD